MKISNIFKASLCLLVVAALNTSCRFEEEDLFDEAASIRLDNTNAKMKEILCSATPAAGVSEDANGQYGWVMQYFAAGTEDVDVPGVNITAKFYPNGKVVMGGNHAYIVNGNGSYVEQASTYEFLKEEGAVLAFNTWNDLLTGLVDPLNDGEGYHGDQNLVMMTFGADVMTFRGERHSARSRLVRLDREARRYIKDCDDMKKAISNDVVTHYYLISGADTMYLSDLSTGRYIVGERIKDPLIFHHSSCVFTPTGFRSEWGDSINGAFVEEFNLAEDKKCLYANRGNVRCEPMWDEYMATHDEVWDITPESMTTTQKNYFTKINNAIKSYNPDWSLRSIGLGKSNAGTKGLVLTFYTTPNKSDKHVSNAAIAMTSAHMGYGLIRYKVASKPSGDALMNSINSSAPDVKTVATDFAKGLAAYYNVEADDNFHPFGGNYVSLDGKVKFTTSKAYTRYNDL